MQYLVICTTLAIRTPFVYASTPINIPYVRLSYVHLWDAPYTEYNAKIYNEAGQRRQFPVILDKCWVCRGSNLAVYT